MATVGVLGAGIAGLSAAYQLHRRGLSARVLEATDRVGGVIRTACKDGFLIEQGPNSIRASSPHLESVIQDLGLESERVWAPEAASTRYVVRDGRPVALPTSLGSAITTPLFSLRAKLRLLAEPFIRRRPPTEGDESVASFTRRRLGQEILDYAVNPFVRGVFAGDPRRLSVRHAFERLADLEREHGSLFLGLLRRAWNDRSDEKELPSGLFSFREGLQTLPDALAVRLGDRITRNARVTAIRPQPAGWEVRFVPPNETTQSVTFDALISTLPLHELAKIALETPVDSRSLAEVPYPPVSVLAMGYPREAVSHPLDGFGLLVPQVEKDLQILGTLFSSSLFPNRAPKARVLLTTFVGGARDPDLARRPTTALQSVVERDLAQLLGVKDSPSFVHHVSWPQAIPQYTIGYRRILETLEKIEERHPTLAFAGNYREGVSVGDALSSGIEAANRICNVLAFDSSGASGRDD